MAVRPVNPPAIGWSLTLSLRLWRDLSRHLFRNDANEHGAVLLAGRSEGPRGPRLLGRELILAQDDIDYVPGTTGYRALSADFVRDAAVRARDERLGYLAVHNHPEADVVGFSGIDLASHERGYPTLRQLTGQIVGGLVLTPQAAAGDLWLPDGSRRDLAELVIPGNNLIRLRPHPTSNRRLGQADSRHDRQTRLFGDRGQETLRALRIAVVGLGGVGSIIVEFLARLGVGDLVLIDPDHVDDTNLPRLVAAETTDVGRPKIELAARNARRANPDARLTLLGEGVESERARAALATCDWIFLAADTHSARHWVNTVIHNYVIPATQAGVKIPVTETGDIGQIHAVSRLLLPGEGCMWCNNLIDPTELAIDMQPEAERRAARYIDEVPAPSVIALNSLAASEAVNHFMLAATGLHIDDYDTGAVLQRPRTRERDLVDHRQDSACPACSLAGPLGRGVA